MLVFGIAFKILCICEDVPILECVSFYIFTLVLNIVTEISECVHLQHVLEFSHQIPVM
jgi:hypothetical protein